MKWVCEYAYKKAVLKNGSGMWFVFDRTGTRKIKVCLSEKEAREYADYWEMCYEY